MSWAIQVAFILHAEPNKQLLPEFSERKDLQELDCHGRDSEERLMKGQELILL